MRSQSKTAPEFVPAFKPLERSTDGVWHVRGYAEAKTILLADTVQAGFKAEMIWKMPAYMAKPILYQEGSEHRDQRIQTAKYFTPTITHQRYQAVMEECADQIVSEFKRAGRADLLALTTRMAMSVAAEIIGLTNSPVGPMTRRLNTILTAEIDFGLSLRQLLNYLHVQWPLFQFFVLDVKPAIRARRKALRDDVISHLLAKNRTDTEILTECITYGAAGMVTTQEFIAVAAWHCLQRPELRATMLDGDPEARYRFLNELLRLEPVVSHLYRRPVADLDIVSQGLKMTLPAGALINLHIRDINADGRVVGAEPLHLLVDRTVEKGVPGSVMGFGTGPHKCPGEFVALVETDVFLRRLLAIDGLCLEREPAVKYNDIVNGYELQGFIIAIDGYRRA